MDFILTDTQKAYIAGIIDGEGCIYISKSRIRKDIGMKHCHYRAGLDVKNTDKRMIEFLHTSLGGHKSIEKRRTHKDRIVYKWGVVGENAVDVLRVVYPYLQCKQDQSDVLFQLRQTFTNSHFTIKNEIPHWILQFREGCYKSLKELHFVFSGKGQRV